MKRDFDLAGTLMYKDVPLAEFCIKPGVATKFIQLSDDTRFFPFEMILHPNGSTLVNALLERIVPETRQGLLEDLRAVGIPYYDVSAILKYQNASSVEDCNWVRFEDGPQTWEELLKKIGYTEVW